MIDNPHIGSSFDDFLKEEGVLEETNAAAIKRVIAWQIEEAMKAQGLTKSAMAIWKNQLERSCVMPRQERLIEYWGRLEGSMAPEGSQALVMVAISRAVSPSRSAMMMSKSLALYRPTQLLTAEVHWKVVSCGALVLRTFLQVGQRMLLHGTKANTGFIRP